MKHLACMFAILLLFGCGGAGAQHPLPAGFEGLEAALADVALEPVAAAIPVLASPAARGVAGRFAATIGNASSFFEENLGWRRDFRLVVLSREDWPKVTSAPYPAPHVWSRDRLVVMPESLRDFPGFDSWGFGDLELNAALPVHEIGHALIHRFAIPWDQMTRTTDELLANVMLAAFVAAEMPGMMRLLDGAPPGFAPPGTRSLSDLDYLYDRIGLETYAWHQFELARAAAHMVRSQTPSQLVPALAAALRGGRADLPETTIGKLETVVPGVGPAFSAFAPESGLRRAATGPCQFLMGAPDGSSTRTLLVVENRSHAAVGIRDHVTDKQYADQLLADGLTPERDPQAFDIPASQVLPGRFGMFDIQVGQDVAVAGRGCIRGAATPVRYVIAD